MTVGAGRAALARERSPRAGRKFFRRDRRRETRTYRLGTGEKVVLAPRESRSMGLAVDPVILLPLSVLPFILADIGDEQWRYGLLILGLYLLFDVGFVAGLGRTPGG